MQSRRSSFPAEYSNQMQSANNTASVQAFSANPSPANLYSILQNSMPIQLQSGTINPQIPMNSSSTVMPNMPPLMTQQPIFINQLGIPQMGFSLQNHLNYINTVPMFVNQVNPCQLQGQPYTLNFSNFPQQLNQNMGFPHLQNLMQKPIPSQVVGPQNRNSFANPFLVVGQQANQRNFVTGKRIQQIPGNLSTMPQTQNSRSCASLGLQGIPVNSGQSITSSSNWKMFPSKNFKKNPKKEASKLGFTKSQSHRMNNGKRKFRFSNEHEEKGYCYEKATNFVCANAAEKSKEIKSSLALTYTEQEIEQWREERRKNYPSKANIEKKSSERLTNSEVINNIENKYRRQQLKKILAKQAELGVEVAEIPSLYLSDSEKQVNRRESNIWLIAKKGKSENKQDRRGGHKKNDQLAKQQNLAEKNKRKPTLLQKLLSADVRKDELHLLQVFRFMLLNSFFENWPEKPLKFPLIVVKDDEDNEVAAKKSLLAGKDVYEVRKKRTTENFVLVHASNEDDSVGDKSRRDCDEDDERVEQATNARGKCSLPEETDKTEEEGEIID